MLLQAKALNVDYAPAVTGFERHGGRMCPTIEGIVVAEEHAQAVVARCGEFRSSLQRWPGVFDVLWLRMRVRRSGAMICCAPDHCS